MPRNFDAFALFFIVLIVLVSGYFVDHGPFCVSDGVRFGNAADRGFDIELPQPPAPPALPKLPALPPLPRL